MLIAFYFAEIIETNRNLITIYSGKKARHLLTTGLWSFETVIS